MKRLLVLLAGLASFAISDSSFAAKPKKWLPRIDRPPAPNSASRVLTYDKATDEAVWEGKMVKRSDPIPE